MNNLSDPIIKECLDDFEEILVDPDMGPREALEIMKIAAIYNLGRAIRDCFESTSRLPSIPEAIVMAAKEITSELSGNGLDIRLMKEAE